MAMRNQTEEQKEFQKERRRLLQAVRRGEQKGYIYPEDVVPPLPKHPTKKQLEDIRKTTPKDLYEVAQFVDKETGEIVSGKTVQERTKGRTLKQPKTSIPKVTTHINNPRIGASSKKPLSADEKHIIAVNRGRKAWQTRRAKMTDEEYALYIEAFKQRMKIARENKRKSNEEYPTISMIDKVKEKVEELDRFYYQSIDDITNNLNELKREVPPWFKIEKRKGHLMEIFQDTINYYGDNLNELEEYLITQMSTIDTHLDIIRYDSKDDKVEISFIVLGNILNRGSLSPIQAEQLSRMTEYYEGYEEE